MTIYGKATVEGNKYPVCINVTYSNEIGRFVTGINCSEGIVNLTFESVDDTKVRSSLSYRLDDFFRGMENLKTIHFGGNFQGNVSQAPNMFNGCVNLQYVDIETLDFGTATIYSGMFKDCSSLENVTIHCANGTNYAGMFEGCTSLREVKVTNSTGSALYMGSMFKDCSSLEKADLSGINSSKTLLFGSMFKNCSSLEEIDMENFDLSSANNLIEMFKGCTSLRSIDLSAATWPDDTISVRQMFYGCENLEEMIISEDFRPQDCEDMLYVDDPALLKLKGEMSTEFKENVLPTLKSSNRYLGEIKITSQIELEGKELKDEMFSILCQDENGKVSEAYNYAANGNKIDNVMKIYEPGTQTFIVEERYVTNPGEQTLVSVPLSEAENYICEEEKRTYTVDISLMPDGTLTI